MVTDNTPARGGGRPPIGDPVKWALPPELRTALRSARCGTESEAAAARRLLAAALTPAAPSVLLAAAAAIDGTADPDPTAAGILAAQLRHLAAQLEPGPAATGPARQPYPGEDVCGALDGTGQWSCIAQDRHSPQSGHIAHPGGGHLACDTPGVSHELHYDETDNVSWKDGRPED